ncbi:MAG TPA: DUF937 domain-containing protein [Gemmatimonadaceae bacterium]|nr:DUF937 domain-containing protein [Gemmatimonadaceae bacterium]
MGLLDAVQGQLDQSAVTQISQKLGINPALAQTAVAAAVPMIVAGMAKHAATPGGAQTIENAAESHRDVADNVGSVLQAGPPEDNTGLLGKILGQHHDTVKDGVQKATGLDTQKAGKLLMMLSPIVPGCWHASSSAGRTPNPGRPISPRHCNGRQAKRGSRSRSRLLRRKACSASYSTASDSTKNAP